MFIKTRKTTNKQKNQEQKKRTVRMKYINTLLYNRCTVLKK